MVAARHFRSPWHTGGNASAAAALPCRTPRGVGPIIAGGSDRRAHQPGSTPIDIPETVPNPAYTPAPAPAPAPERAPTKVPEKVPEKEISGEGRPDCRRRGRGRAGTANLSALPRTRPVMRARQPLVVLCGLLQTRLEAAPIWRYSVIAVQLHFLRAIAPVEILV